MLFRFVEIDSPLDFCKMEDETPFHNCTKTNFFGTFLTPQSTILGHIDVSANFIYKTPETEAILTMSI